MTFHVFHVRSFPTSHLFLVAFSLASCMDTKTHDTLSISLWSFFFVWDIVVVSFLLCFLYICTYCADSFVSSKYNPNVLDQYFEHGKLESRSATCTGPRRSALSAAGGHRPTRGLVANHPRSGYKDVVYRSSFKLEVKVIH